MEKAPVKLFLCGKAFNPNIPIEDQGETDLRAFLLLKLEAEVSECRVFLGEHTELINQYNQARFGSRLSEETTNLSHFEMALANYVDLVVIFPESAGSFVELGMFSAAGQIAKRLLIIADKNYEQYASFVKRGALRAAVERNAKVEWLHYSDRDAIFASVKERVNMVKEHRVIERYFQD
jgi:hypothetical protein